MRLRDLREDRDLTQKQVADFLSIKQNTYSQYENGVRQLPLICSFVCRGTTPFPPITS